MNPADRWEEWNSWGVPNYPHAKVVQFCLRRYSREVRSGMRVLDLGCGSGVNTAFLVAEGFRVAGTDISQNGIENTRRRLEARQMSADLHVSSADRIQFDSETFDLVICIGVFDAAGPSVARTSVREVARVLRPGGFALFVFASDRDHRILGENEYRLHGYTAAEVSELFDAGFDSVWIDRYVTTYEGGRTESNDWLVTVKALGMVWIEIFIVAVYAV